MDARGQFGDALAEGIDRHRVVAGRGQRREEARESWRVAGIMSHRNATNFHRIGATHSGDRARLRSSMVHCSPIARHASDVTAQQRIHDATARRAAAHLKTCQQENVPARTFRAAV